MKKLAGSLFALPLLLGAFGCDEGIDLEQLDDRAEQVLIDEYDAEMDEEDGDDVDPADDFVAHGFGGDPPPPDDLAVDANAGHAPHDGPSDFVPFELEEPQEDDFTVQPGAGQAGFDRPTEFHPFELNQPDLDDFVVEPPDDDHNEY